MPCFLGWGISQLPMSSIVRSQEDWTWKTMKVMSSSDLILEGITSQKIHQQKILEVKIWGFGIPEIKFFIDGLNLKKISYNFL